jgi:hypothetical protein
MMQTPSNADEITGIDSFLFAQWANDAKKNLRDAESFTK